MGDEVEDRANDGTDGVSAAVPGAQAARSTGRGSPTNSPNDPPLATVLGELDRAGWTGQMMPLEGGSIRCLTCREEFPADQVDADEVRRLEGASDPADMVIVVPV